MTEKIFNKAMKELEEDGLIRIHVINGIEAVELTENGKKAFEELKKLERI